MRSLAALSLALMALSAQAETSPPTPEELALAKADCQEEVAPACLFTLALDRLLQTLPQDRVDEDSVVFLNYFAMAQIRAGDQDGALRTLGLTATLPETLLRLGRWDEAWVKAQASFVGTEPPFGETHEGNFKRRMVFAMLDRGETELALSTALIIPTIRPDEREKALLDIVTHTATTGDLATAVKAVGMMQDEQSFLYYDRATALRTIVEAQAKAGAMADAEALLDNIGHPASTLPSRLILAKAWHDAGSDAGVERQLDLVLEAHTSKDAERSWPFDLLIDSADLAMSMGMTQTARKHALAAFELFDQPTIESRAMPTEFETQRLSNVLERVGAPGKAAALRTANSRMTRNRLPQNPTQVSLSIARLISQLQKDRVEIGPILFGLHETMADRLNQSDSERATEVVRVLLSAGLAVEARTFVDDVAAQDDGVIDLAASYTALIAHDLALAPDLLAAIDDGRTRLSLSLTWAEELAKAGRQAEARDLLRSLLAQMSPCGSESPETYLAEGGTRPDVITVQDRLGYAEDAGLARQECLSRALAAEPDPKDAYYLLVSLAGTFS